MSNLPKTPENRPERDASQTELKGLYDKVEGYVFREGSTIYATDPKTHFGYHVLENGQAVPIMDNAPHFELAYLSGGQILAQKPAAAQYLRLTAEDMVTIGYAEHCFEGEGTDGPHLGYMPSVATFQVDTAAVDRHLTYSVSVDRRSKPEFFTSSFEDAEEPRSLTEAEFECAPSLNVDDELTLSALAYALERHAQESLRGRVKAMRNLTTDDTKALIEVMTLLEPQPQPPVA